MLIAILAEKLDNTVSKADTRRLICNKYHKFLEFLAIFFIQNLVQDILHDESLTRINRKNGHKGTKQNCLLKFIFVFWCLGGENVLPQNVVDPPGRPKNNFKALNPLTLSCFFDKLISLDPLKDPV